MSSDPVDEGNTVPPASQAPPMPNPYKKESMALVLSLVLGLFGFNGVGHIYVGKIRLGIGILIGSIIIYYAVVVGIMIFALATLDGGTTIIMGVVVGIAYIVLFIWQIIHSKKLCKRYNEYYQQNNRPPW